MKTLRKIEHGVGMVTRAIASFCLFVVFVLFIANICTRPKFITWNPKWIDEVIQFFLVWMIFLGAADLVRTGEHFIVDILTDKLHGTLTGRILRMITTVIMLITYAVICFFALRMTINSNAKMMSTLPTFIRLSWFHLSVFVSSVLMVLYAIRDVIFAVADIVTGGKITVMLDEEKAANALEDEDAKAIAEAAAALKEDAEKNKEQEE